MLTTSNPIQMLINKSKRTCPVILPVMHTTPCCLAENVFKIQKLSVTRCEVFNEDLLYFFYGKPSYVVANQNKEKARTDDLLSPICFIIDINKLVMNRIFPFDSGAYHKGLYNEFVPQKVDISDYEIEPDIVNIQKFIELFYKSNENYVMGKCVVDDNILTNTITQSLGHILKATGTFNFDDRANTLEIVCKNSVNISELAVAIIIPSSFRRNEHFASFISNNPNINVITYSTHYPIVPFRHNESVYQAAINYLKCRGLIND